MAKTAPSVSHDLRSKSFVAPNFEAVKIIGVGGTGSYLAQHLAKMVAGYALNDLTVLLIDADQVEEKNCQRQNFWRNEIGENKAEALAYRLNLQYGVSFGAIPTTWETACSPYNDQAALMITCVDNLATRKLFRTAPAWLDLGNLETVGQAVFGTTAAIEEAENEIAAWQEQPHVTCLPNAYLKTDLATRHDRPSQTISCADHPFAEQGVLVNEMAAQAGAMIAFQLLIKGVLETPAVFFDTAKGQMLPSKITRNYLSV